MASKRALLEKIISLAEEQNIVSIILPYHQIKKLDNI